MDRIQPIVDKFVPRDRKVKYSFYLNDAEDERGRFRSMTEGYRQGDPLVLAYTGEVEADADLAVLEQLFRMFNMEHPKDYTNRSMSVGDVVILGDGDQRRAFSCASIGWQPIDMPSI